ncbi:hypothetical protein ANO11243_003080 [Dothideomycetidae sp. 11243]|nr:hypothetical protein ANO11243_003080 [fungal sp. No.11243]
MAPNILDFHVDGDSEDRGSCGTLEAQLLLDNALGPGWSATQWAASAFAAEHFLAAMLNLIRNPNITSSHLFRADISYDSDNDASMLASAPLSALQPKISRIVTRLLQVTHKLSQGVKTGYEKRGHHDRVVPQRKFQDTYARLKEVYAKQIINNWREQTDPGKHVFEDLAITAFLIELWRGMYDIVPACERLSDASSTLIHFPGFVDIGCGNGLLVHLLRAEGYHGSGFDVRQRRSWTMYPKDVQESLHVKILVPSIFESARDRISEDRSFSSESFEPGVFIISNHADELTAWTPLLALLSNSPFVAIPCCSHSLGGTRFRAPKSLRSARSMTGHVPTRMLENKDSSKGSLVVDAIRNRQAAESGSLRRRDTDNTDADDDDEHKLTRQASTPLDDQVSSGKAPSKKSQPSAYAALCNYVSLLATEVGYFPETEMLRIPSTRNACMVGRKWKTSEAEGESTEAPVTALFGKLDEVEKRRREDMVRGIVTSEMGMSLEEVHRDWLLRAEAIAGNSGRGH